MSAEMDGDQRLMLFWIDPVDEPDHLAAKPELAEKFYFHCQCERQARNRSKDQRNEILVVQIQHW